MDAMGNSPSSGSCRKEHGARSFRILRRRVLALTGIMAIGWSTAGCGASVTSVKATTPVSHASQSPAQSNSRHSSPNKAGTHEPAVPWVIGLTQLNKVPVHYRFVVTETPHTAVIHSTGALDPIDHESEATTVTLLTSPANMTITEKSIQIGNHAWSYTNPPGRWFVTTTPARPPINATALLSALTHIHAIPGKAIDGHMTTGITATITGKVMSQVLNLPSAQTRADMSIRAMVFDVYVGGQNHVREITLVEHVVQAGHPYLVNEVTYYFGYGKALDLQPPTV